MAGDPDFADDAMAFILAGGRGSRLKELTSNCAKPAIPFGGRAKIIDFALSNAINSGIPRIAVATQYKQDSLVRHVEAASNLFRTECGGMIEILPGSPCAHDAKHYDGTAGAIFQNIEVIDRHRPKYVVVLAGDHIYKMDYRPMLQQHIAAGADVTIGCVLVPRQDATAFGVMSVDGAGRVTSFVEKPKAPPPAPGASDCSLASMGIYVFDTARLLHELRRDASDRCSSHDFGADIIPKLVRHGKAFAHRFSDSCVRSVREKGDYWRDVGTLDAYFEANLDILAQPGPLDLDDINWPLWTERAGQFGRPSYKGGCAPPFLLRGGLPPEAKVTRSLVFGEVTLGNGCAIEDSIILPHCHIGPNARLSRVIVDEGVHIPAGLVIGEDPDFDAQYFRCSEKGICLVTQAMIDQIQQCPGMRTAA